MAYTKASNKASQRYQKKHLERLYITVKKGEKAKIQAAAKAAGKSLNAYVLSAIEMQSKMKLKSKTKKTSIKKTSIKKK